MAKELKYVMLLDCYGVLLTEHQRSIMEMYYCEDLSLAEISGPLGITRQAVMSMIKRTEAILNDYEEKLGFARRLRAMLMCIDKIETASADIGDERLKNIISGETAAIRELL
ncbi:MAG: DNA-binding protein [Ruminococcus sp.]|nr:DNA-binding protein [Ruminococcus sp.]